MGSIPPCAGPWKTGASSSLRSPWPAKPGGEGRREQSSIPCDASLAAAPGRIRSQPKRKNLWRKDFSSSVCVCVYVLQVGGP